MRRQSENQNRFRSFRSLSIEQLERRINLAATATFGAGLLRIRDMAEGGEANDISFLVSAAGFVNVKDGAAIIYGDDKATLARDVTLLEIDTAAQDDVVNLGAVNETNGFTALLGPILVKLGPETMDMMVPPFEKPFAERRARIRL